MAATKVLYVRIPADLHEKLESEAGNHFVSLTAFCTRALDSYLVENFEWAGTQGLHLP
jgi:predicted HicB family RNase H-like nuclease